MHKSTKWLIGMIVVIFLMGPLSVILLSLSGIIWLLFLIPGQHSLITLSNNLTKSGKLSKKFFEVLHRWYFWGITATILPIISLVIMVLKPKLW